MKIYKLTPKGLKKTKMNSSSRFVKNGSDSVILFMEDSLVQSDLYWKKFPDSHLELTNESLPKVLFAGQSEIDHIQKHNIDTLKINIKVKL